MEEEERQKLLARAKTLEGKMLYVKAADILVSLGMEDAAAVDYEKASAFDRAEVIFRKLGKKADADRCKLKKEAAATGRSWLDMQAEFQKDAGNPY